MGLKTEATISPAAASAAYLLICEVTSSPHTHRGLIKTVGDLLDSSEDELLAQLRETAAALGDADRIVIGATDAE